MRTAPIERLHVFLELDGNGALYSQLTRALKQAILRGHLKAGSRLPATRTLAAELGLSRNTVLTAYESLCAEQLAVTTACSGTFVRQVVTSSSFVYPPADVPPQTRFAARLRGLPPLALRAPPPTLAYDLQYGEPLADPLLASAWRRVLARAAVRADRRYPPSAGRPSATTWPVAAEWCAMPTTSSSSTARSRRWRCWPGCC